MTYEEQLNITAVNAKIIEEILLTYTADEINDYYYNHTQKESLNHFGLRTVKQLIKLLTITKYDFSQTKPTLRNCNKKENRRSHESYVAGGKKSAETQKEHWNNKSEEEKESYREMQRQAHSTDEFKEKIRQINIDRFVNMSEEEKEEYAKVRSISNKNKWAADRELILSKAYKTRQENDTFNSSSPEETYFNFLVDKYGENNVVRQYRDDRYPFKCDFYIKSLDLFIELNLSWTHGGMPFEMTEECHAKLEVWKEKAKTSAYYEKAIYTWTDLDVRKRIYAKINKLNYLVFYSEEELYE